MRDEFKDYTNPSLENSTAYNNKLSRAYINKPKISVIVPVFKEEKMLQKTLPVFSNELKSAFNIELIVSDGGSNDKTVEIASNYADKIALHTECRKQTIAEGRNKGASLACGDIFCFMNADTVPEDPFVFFEKVRLWAANQCFYSGSDALACYVKPFSDETIFKDVVFYKLHNLYVQTLNKFGVGMGRGECQIMKKEAFFSVDGYNEKIAAGEDFDLYRRISKQHNIHFAKDLIVAESPRRFRKYGYFRTVFSWTLNALTVMLFGKSYSKEWEAVR